MSSRNNTIASIVVCLCSLVADSVLPAGERPNLLLITVDDMNCDSVGAFGCKLPNTTPHLDRLASQGMRFEYAHVQCANCMPSRNVMWSGRYPHNNGVEGFYQVPDAKHPHLADVMKEAGYFTAIRHKVSHSTPYHPYTWDLVLDELPDGSRAHVKDASTYGVSTTRGIEAAREAGKPFCLVINVADPHKPFYAEGKGGVTVPDPHVPSLVFEPDRVPIPGFLFDDPIVRKELSHYYSSVRRADDCVGEVLAALDRSGQADSTFVLFLSDHGMPLPFAKTQLYHHSTRTPLIVKWPGVSKPGAVDDRHMVSAVDFMPTLLDVIGAKHPGGFDGRSFASVLRGEEQEGRDHVIKEYNENAGGSRDPMRGVQTRKHLYLFNPWSNGTRVMATATNGTPTCKRMAVLAQTDKAIAARYDLYQHRVPEELYDVEKDPDCLYNLIDSPDQTDELSRLRGLLEEWMANTGDHMLPVFRDRTDPDLREDYVKAREQEAETRRKTRRGGKAPNRSGAKLISWQLPDSVTPGKAVTVKVRHRLKADLGEQLLHVTLKGGKANTRIHREVVKVSGTGEADVVFQVPDPVPDGVVSFAVFIGEEFSKNLQHLVSGAVPAK